MRYARFFSVEGNSKRVEGRISVNFNDILLKTATTTAKFSVPTEMIGTNHAININLNIVGDKTLQTSRCEAE